MSARLLAATLVILGACSIPNPSDSERTTWRLAEEATGTEVPLVVVIGSSSCNAYDHLEIDESEEVVSIRAYISVEEPQGDAICTDDLTTRRVTAHLEEPLGGRRLAGCNAPDQGVGADDVPCDRVVDPF